MRPKKEEKKDEVKQTHNQILTFFIIPKRGCYVCYFKFQHIRAFGIFDKEYGNGLGNVYFGNR